MVVPYGDPSKDHYRKNAFDAGEYGIGSLTNSLTLGCDCLGEIYYFDAVMNTGQGRAVHNTQRRVHARRGLRHPVEAH